MKHEMITGAPNEKNKKKAHLSTVFGFLISFYGLFKGMFVLSNTICSVWMW